MRVFVEGISDLAKSIRTNLGQTFVISDAPGDADRVIDIVVEDRNTIMFDSVDNPLEQSIFRFLRKLTAIPLLTDTANGIQSDRKCRILVPEGKEAQDAVEKAVQQGFLALINRTPVDLSKVAVEVSPDQVPQMRALLGEVFNQLCAVLAGVSREAWREQAKSDYAVIAAQLGQMRAELNQAIETGRAQALDDRLLIAEECRVFQLEVVRAMNPEGNRNAGLWARLVAAWRGKVVVLP